MDDIRARLYRMYNIKLEQFEGPMDLLLQLIEKNELDITRVSLAKVADQFIVFMQENQEISLEQMADFLDVAARLLLLKSKALLPILQFTEEEEEEIMDLEERLKMHAFFKERAMFLGEKVKEGRRMFSREAFVGFEKMFLPRVEELHIFPEDLENAIKKLLDALPDLEKLKEKVLRKTVRLEEKIRRLQALISKRAKFTFFEVIRDRNNYVEVIVSFLAILELVRQKQMTVRQEDYFGDIYVERAGK